MEKAAFRVLAVNPEVVRTEGAAMGGFDVAALARAFPAPQKLKCLSKLPCSVALAYSSRRRVAIDSVSSCPPYAWLMPMHPKPTAETLSSPRRLVSNPIFSSKPPTGERSRSISRSNRCRYPPSFIHAAPHSACRSAASGDNMRKKHSQCASIPQLPAARCEYD